MVVSIYCNRMNDCGDSLEDLTLAGGKHSCI